MVVSQLYLGPMGKHQKSPHPPHPGADSRRGACEELVGTVQVIAPGDGRSLLTKKADSFPDLEWGWAETELTRGLREKRAFTVSEECVFLKITSQRKRRAVWGPAETQCHVALLLKSVSECGLCVFIIEIGLRRIL